MPVRIPFGTYWPYCWVRPIISKAGQWRHHVVLRKTMMINSKAYLSPSCGRPRREKTRAQEDEQTKELRLQGIRRDRKTRRREDEKTREGDKRRGDEETR